MCSGCCHTLCAKFINPNDASIGCGSLEVQIYSSSKEDEQSERGSVRMIILPYVV